MFTKNNESSCAVYTAKEKITFNKEITWKCYQKAGRNVT
jgi:hypothetical protein